MGVGQSIPSKLTHEKLFELTKDSRNVMNLLLEYMLKEVSVRDFLSLSDPKQCKKYVLFMANNLYKYFYELKLFPTKTKQGVLVFRKAEDLTTPDKDVENEKQGLCLVLAYYYTRIFQIYGALALTLLDDIQLASKTGMIAIMKDQKQQLLPPGQRQYYATAGDLSYLSLGYFIFLQSFLTRMMEDDFFVTKYSGSGTKQGKVYFKKQSSVDSNVQKGTFKIMIGTKLPAYIDMYAIRYGVNNFKIEFQPLRYYPKSSTTLKSVELPNKILSSKILTVKLTPSLENGESIYTIDSTNQSVLEYFTELFQEIIMYVRDLTDDSHSVVESEIQEELRLHRTIQNLTKTKPLGHCIARALQLLQSQPIDDKTALSNICRAKFLETSTTLSGSKTTLTRSGIPEPGSPLEDSPGLAALSQLFYEIVYEATPKLAISEQKGSDGFSSMDEYRTFMKNMAILFGDNKDPTDPSKSRSTDNLVKQGLKGIKNRRDKEICRQLGTTESIRIPNQTAKQVSQYVNKLFQLQLQHAAKCGAIFKKLFSIQRDKSTNHFKISLNNNIIKKGFPEIEKINTEARRLLVDYYSHCEETYRDGVKSIYDYKKSTAPTAPAATS